MNGDLGVLILAAVMLTGMVFLARWVFRPAPSRRRVLVPGDAVPGLLRTIAPGLRRTDATALRAVFGDANIRSSMSARRDGRFDVSVFVGDEERARTLLPPGGYH
jgi:hypothetical protein